MKITLHLIKKDLTQLQTLFAGWIGALVLGAIASQVQFAVESTSPWSQLLYVASNIASAAGWLISLVITVRLVLDDALNDPKAFWATRPISRSQLLAAKVGVLLLISTIPALITTGLLAWHRIALNDLLLSTAAEILQRAGVGFSLALLVTLSRGFSGFALRLIAVYAVTHFVSSTVSVLVLSSGHNRLMIAPESARASAEIAGHTVALVLSVALLARAYLSQNSSLRSLAVYTAALTAVLTPKLWSWDFLKQDSLETSAQVESARFTVENSRLIVLPGSRGLQTLSAKIAAISLGLGEVAMPLSASAPFLRAPEGRAENVLDAIDPLGWNADPIKPAELAVTELERALAPLHLENPPLQHSSTIKLFSLPADASLDELQNGNWKLKADILSVRRHINLAKEHALVVEQSGSSNDSFSIHRVIIQRGRPVVTVRERMFDPLFRRGSELETPMPFVGGWVRQQTKARNVLYLLVNREHGDAYFPDKDLPLPLRRIGDFSQQDRWLEFGAAPSDPLWAKGATLLRVHFESRGLITVKLAAEGITLHNWTESIRNGSRVPDPQTRPHLAELNIRDELEKRK